MNQKDIKQFLIINLIIIITFLLYVEFSVGNVCYRINHLGIKCLNFKNALYYLIEPLKNKFLWNVELLDVNYIFVLIVSNMFYFMLKI